MIRHRGMPSVGYCALKANYRRPMARPTTVRPKYRRTTSGEECNTFTLHIVLHPGIHPVAPHSAENELDAPTENQKAAELKLQKRAGATPLFRLSAAQKVREVAPALFNVTRQFHCRVHRR